MGLLLCLQRYQHIYLGALYGLLVVKAVLVDDFVALAAGCIGPLKLARMTPRETAVFWGSKALYMAYFIMLPAMWSEHSLAALIALWLISEMVAGWLFAFLFQVSTHTLRVLACMRGRSIWSTVSATSPVHITVWLYSNDCVSLHAFQR